MYKWNDMIIAPKHVDYIPSLYFIGATLDKWQFCFVFFPKSCLMHLSKRKIQGIIMKIKL